MRRLSVCLVLFAIVTFSTVSTSARAGEKVLRFNMTSDGYPPFMIHRTDSTPEGGIIHDAMITILHRLGYDMRSVWIPKKREQISLDLGKMDAMAVAVEWVREPEKYIYSDPLVKVSNVLYSPIDRPVDFKKIDDLSGMTAITHLGYVYPPMAPHFRDGIIRRHDTTSETSMLKMVMAGRGDFAIVNDLVGNWLIQKNRWQGQLASSSRDVTYYDYRILFTRKWAALLPAFNRELNHYIDSGELQRSIAQYVEGAPIKKLLVRN